MAKDQPGPLLSPGAAFFYASLENFIVEVETFAKTIISHRKSYSKNPNLFCHTGDFMV